MNYSDFNLKMNYSDFKETKDYIYEIINKENINIYQCYYKLLYYNETLKTNHVRIFDNITKLTFYINVQIRIKDKKIIKKDYVIEDKKMFHYGNEYKIKTKEIKLFSNINEMLKYIEENYVKN